MKHNLLKSVIISVILLMGVSNAWGATNTTVYYAVPTSVVGSYTVKCNVNYKGDGDDWQQHNMTKTDKTYDGYPIYSCTFTDKYNGLGRLQFQLYDGNTHKSQEEPIKSWTTASTYNGKLWKYEQSGWNTYRYDQHGFEAANNGIKYYSNLNANDEEWNFNGQSAQTKELGEVTSLYLKEWFVQLYENWAGAQGNIKFQYNIHPTANSAGNYTEIPKKWEDLGNWNNGWLYPKYGNNEQNINLLNGLPGSGKYTMSFKYYDSDLKLTSPVHKLNWTYNIVPSVNNFTVTASNVVSGTGTSGDPYVIACGKTTTLTVSGNKASTDANSSLYAKFGNDNYSSTLTKNLTPNSTKQSVQVKAKYYNSKDDLSGTEKSTTIYYRAQTFAVNITSSGNGTVTPSETQQVGANKVEISAAPNDGYKFDNWSKTGNVTIADANSASTTITATGTGSVTANFSEAKYNITISSANTNQGSVDKSSANVGKFTSATITATPKAGYEFVNWTVTGGAIVASSTNSSTTLTATAEGTVKANFREITYAVTITTNNVNFGTVSPTSKNVGIITPVSISASPKAGYRFVNWTATEGITITNPSNASTTIKATKAGTVTATFEKEPDVNVYLKANGWKSDGVRFAVYAFNDQAQTTWVDAQVLDCSGDYYVFPIPAEYNKVIFCRMNPNNQTNNWENRFNQTNTFTIGINNMFEFTTWGDTKGDGFQAESGEECSGNWTTYSPPTYTVTLEKTTYGKYAVELNGQKYYSSQSEDVVINNVPIESTLRLVSSESFNAAYNNNMCIQTHDGVDFEELNAGHRICGNTIIKENFTTLADHTVYLRVPTSLGSWNTSGANYIYSHNNTAKYDVVRASTPTDEEIYKESGYDYFKFVIPAGCRTFRFERKTAQYTAATNVTEDFTRYLPFEMTNCYTIKGIYSENIYYGSWGMSLANGDYRLLYVEQVVEKSNASGNEWKTVVTRKKAHPSNIIKKGTASQIVSLHVYKERKYTANAGGGKTYESSSNPEIILQQYSNGGWVDKERHMVLGPLQTLPGMAMAPGRRNTAAATATLVYDDGIEIIKDDNEDGRVWNFTVKQDANGVATLPLDGGNLKPYTGNYYIRTDNSEGGWMDYTIPGNHMHFSQYAKDNSNFSHYFCKWVETNIKPNTKFVIANDYGVAISDTLSEDQFTDLYGNIQENANIRWSWNETTNEIARAYIQGAYDGKAQNENILLDYTTDGTTDATDVILFDTGDWIYSIDVTVKVGSTLKSITATYPKITHTIDSKTINPTTQIFEQELPMLTGGESANTYTVRVLYDFKIDKTLVALVPNEHKAEIAIDVMIERINQDPATQVKADITYTQNQRSGDGSTVYAVMSFTKDHLTSNSKSEQEKLTYWISFPFDVRISDIFGFGEVGQYWMIKYYDGAERAQIGWFLDTKTFWKYKTKKSDILSANTGYVLTLNKKVMDPNSPIFTNTEKVSLYFPSTAKITTIDPDEYTVTEAVKVPTHTCTITSPSDRTTEDSNWNLIGVPSYANKNCTTTTTSVKYFYDYNYRNDTYAVAQNGSQKTFQSMFAYMVQFGGTIDWKSFTFNEGAQGLAAKRNTDSDAEQHNLRLELQQDGNKADHTFIQLQDEDATEMFDMNSDLCKIINAGSNIYSIITTESTPIQVAGNVMPIQETIIPIGVVTSTAGSFTFAMPDGTDGITVELIDYETNTRTNLLLSDYTITLPKGTNETRFALHVKPSKVVTGLENIGNSVNGLNGETVKKYLIDGVLYLQKGNLLYDAQGRCVK